MLLLACTGSVDPENPPVEELPVVAELRVLDLDRFGHINKLHTFESGLITAEVDLDVDAVTWAELGEFPVVDGVSVLDTALVAGTHSLWIETPEGRSEEVAFDVYEETPNVTGALLWYFPNDPWDLKRMWMGHWGGDEAVTMVLGGSHSELAKPFATDVWEQLELLEEYTGGNMKLVVDVHTFQKGVQSVINELPDYCDLDAADTVLSPGEHLDGDGLTWCEDGDTLEIALEDAEADLEFLEAVLFGEGGLLVDPTDPRLQNLVGFYISDEPLNAVYEGVPWSSKDRDAEAIWTMSQYLHDNAGDYLVIADYAADNVVDYDWLAYHYGEDCTDDVVAACEDNWIWAYAADSSIRSPYNTDGVLGKAYGDRRLGLFEEDLAFVNHFGGPHGLTRSYFSIFHDELPNYGVTFYGGYSVEDNTSLVEISTEYAPFVGIWLWQGYSDEWEIEPLWESDYAALLEAMP